MEKEVIIAKKGFFVIFNIVAPHAPANAKFEPTERSKPPVSITRDIPIETTKRVAVFLTIFIMLSIP